MVGVLCTMYACMKPDVLASPVQAFELGAAKWEFENARKAFGDTMRKFAPGGGAGHFLANAIARRTDRVSHHYLQKQILGVYSQESHLM